MRAGGIKLKRKMEKSKLFIVSGYTGFSFHRSMPLMVFTSREDAEFYVYQKEKSRQVGNPYLHYSCGHTCYTVGEVDVGFVDKSGKDYKKFILSKKW